MGVCNFHLSDTTTNWEVLECCSKCCSLFAHHQESRRVLKRLSFSSPSPLHSIHLAPEVTKSTLLPAHLSIFTIKEFAIKDKTISKSRPPHCHTSNVSSKILFNLKVPVQLHCGALLVPFLIIAITLLVIGQPKAFFLSSKNSKCYLLLC